MSPAVRPTWAERSGADRPAAEAVIVLRVLGVDMTQPETIAALAVHLCCEKSSYTTGQVIRPNGGLFV